MNRHLLLIIFTLLPCCIFAQEKLIKDLDKDHINDTTYLDAENSEIICQLSTLKFQKIKSKKIKDLNPMSGILDVPDGFIFFNDFMRLGYKNQFRYNKKLKNMQLIGMST